VERPKEGTWSFTQRGGFIPMPPLDISQFNALLHSKKSDSELISVLREFTMADAKIFIQSAALLGYYW
jgi:hypothetical protein